MDLDELALGMAVETAQLLFVRKKLSFAHDYDNRPFHTDEEYAKTTPLGKLISPEVMSFMSELAKYLEVDFRRGYACGKSIKTELYNSFLQEMF